MTKTARLYGGSLYDLASEEGITDELMEQTEQIRVLLRENPRYIGLLSEPSLAFEERCALIDQAFAEAVHKYLLNFLKLLCERGCLGEFALCCEEYARRYDADHGITRAQVASAVELTKAQQEALQRRLEAVTGKRVRMEFALDRSVIGGLRVRIDGKELDGSVRGRINGISGRLERASL